MRLLVVGALAALALAACGSPPKPFEHDDDNSAVYRPGREKSELSVAPPANMPRDMGWRVATALAVELQSYGVQAVVQPDLAPLRLGGVMSTRDADAGIEIEIAWYVDRGGAAPIGPAVSKTRARPEDYAEAGDRLVSRIAQQAAPRIAALMGRSPAVQPNAPGQVAAGVSVPEIDPDVAVAAAAAPGVPTPPTVAPPPLAPQVKVRVAPVTGAPSDGNRQLFSGMRRALGSSKIVVIDKAGADTFTVVGTVALTPLDEARAQLTVKWVLQDPNGRPVGDLEQSNVVPLAATRGSWTGFGDIVAAAAAEGVLQLLDKALSAAR